MIGTRLEQYLEKKHIPVILVAIVSIAAYSNSFTVPFVLDDFGSIANNYAIRNLFDIPAIWEFYSNRFILYFTFAINYFIHGNEVEGYHITNLLIHIFNGILVYLIFRSLLGLNCFLGKLTGKYRNIISAVAAMLFVSHPIQVNAVTYIVQRTASLAAMFYFLSILNYIRYRTRFRIKYFLLTMLFTVMAMFTKENTITIPFTLIIMEFMFFLKDGKTTWPKRLGFLFILLLTVPIIPGTNLLLNGHSQSDPNVHFKASTSMDRFQYFFTELNVIILYIKLMFIPDRQNFDYSNDFPFSHNLMENYSYVSLVILSVIGFIALMSIKRNRLISLGVIWFYIGLSVESTFISIKDVYFEHRLYFPAAGFIMFIIGVVFLERRKKRVHFFRKPLLLFLTASLFMLVFYTAMTIKRNYIYSDSVRMWQDVVTKAPESDRSHSVLASAYMDKYEESRCKDELYFTLSEKEFKRAIAIRYNNATAHCNLAKLYLLRKDYVNCIREAKEAIRLDATVYGYHNLGQAYKGQGKTTLALEAFLSGYRLNNKISFILKDLGNIYYELKDYKQAEFYYKEYLKNIRNIDKKINSRLEEIQKLT